MLILIGSVVLDVLDVVGWNMVDIAMPALLTVAVVMMLIGLLARSSMTNVSGMMDATIEIQTRQAAREGSPVLKPSQTDWAWLVAAIVPGIVGVLIFVVF